MIRDSQKQERDTPALQEPARTNPESRIPNPVEVVAGLLRDAQGRILLAQRPPGRDWAGYWEFPGGKREPGESALAALRRELVEELGLEINAASPLIRVPTWQGDRLLWLDVHTVPDWQGEPASLEAQAWAWVEPERLIDYPLPPADRPVLPALNQSPWLAITPEYEAQPQRIHDGLLQLAATGIGRALLRLPQFESTTRIGLAEALVEPLRERGCELLIHGDVELAQRLGCGLHLPSRALSQRSQRPLPAGQTVTASAHNRAELQRCEHLDVDAVLLGPVQPTQTHPGQSALGWDGFAALRAHTGRPVYALGGLGQEDFAAARRHGAQGIAAIRRFWPKPSQRSL